MSIDLKIDLSSLAARLDAKSREVAGPDRKLLADSAKALAQAETVLKSVPTVIESNRAAVAISVVSAITAALSETAQMYEDGELPIQTAQNALRAFAGSLLKSVKGEDVPQKPVILRPN